MDYIIRKDGSDLHALPFYNSYQDGLFNPLFPEYAPKSVGGTMSDVRNHDAKGNCTWYAFGRLQEVSGYRVPLEQRRGNAKDWIVDTYTAVEGSIVVFVDGGYGHVAFVEKIANGHIYVSESAYSERGNDFLFKYGRTVEQICNEWGMSVKGYITSPYNMKGIESEGNSKMVLFNAEEGNFKFKQRAHVLDAPNWSTGNRLATYEVGEQVIFEGMTFADDHTWLFYTKEGQKRYVPIQKGTPFGNFV